MLHFVHVDLVYITSASLMMLTFRQHFWRDLSVMSQRLPSGATTPIWGTGHLSLPTYLFIGIRHDKIKNWTII